MLASPRAAAAAVGGERQKALKKGGGAEAKIPSENQTREERGKGDAIQALLVSEG